MILDMIGMAKGLWFLGVGENGRSIPPSDGFERV